MAIDPRTFFALVLILDFIEEFFKFLFLFCRFLFSADLCVAKMTLHVDVGKPL